MRTKRFLAGFLFAGIFTVNAQITDTHTASLSSYGWQAGSVGSNNTFYGPFAGKITTAGNNTFIGTNTGKLNVGGQGNVLLGHNAGSNSSSGSFNTFVGLGSGSHLVSGGWNTFLGSTSGEGIGTGQFNIYLGANSGQLAGSSNAYNTVIGTFAGTQSTGSSNVFIGYNVGRSISGSNLLHIDNTNDTTPLIWGDFTNDNLVFNGKVGITEESLADQANLFPNTAGSVDVSTYQLFVKGGILTEAIRVALKSPSNWADYVFADGYELAPLEDVECFIDENGHLPNVPSAKQLAEDGIELAEMAKMQQEKIEELTLYIIGQNKQLKEQELKIQELEKKYAEVEGLKAAVQQLIDNK